jgi:hypothetical protein
VSMRVRVVLTGVLLVFSLLFALFAARATVGAFQSFQQERQQGDVQTIHPWMTIPYISHVYQVPENYLYDALHLSNARPSRHTTLQELAIRVHRPVGTVIHTVQASILLYRREHNQDHPRTLFSSVVRGGEIT